MQTVFRIWVKQVVAKHRGDKRKHQQCILSTWENQKAHLANKIVFFYGMTVWFESENEEKKQR